MDFGCVGGAPPLDKLLLRPSFVPDLDNVTLALVVQDLLGLRERHRPGQQLDQVPGLEQDVWVPGLPGRVHLCGRTGTVSHQHAPTSRGEARSEPAARRLTVIEPSMRSSLQPMPTSVSVLVIMVQYCRRYFSRYFGNSVAKELSSRKAPPCDRPQPEFRDEHHPRRWAARLFIDHEVGRPEDRGRRTEGRTLLSSGWNASIFHLSIVGSSSGRLSFAAACRAL